MIDPIKDTFPQKDYKKEEDPALFVSTKTGRGPLREDWLQGYRDGTNKAPVMCAYKLIKVEFKYWGMQVTHPLWIFNTGGCTNYTSFSSTLETDILFEFAPKRNVPSSLPKLF